MVELELLESSERPVSFLGEADALALRWSELCQAVVRGLRLAQERARDDRDAGDREEYGQDDGCGFH
jgi:hypothetical protein